MITITENQNQFVTETIEDMVEYICQELADSGEIISGETVYKIIECFAIAKQAEFNGDFNWFLIRINNCVTVDKLPQGGLQNPLFCAMV